MIPETVEVRLPPPSLAPAVVCCIWRRVHSVEPPAVHARVPANIYACVNLVLNGRVELVNEPGGVLLPRFFVTGPFTRPLPTRAVGALQSISLVVQPWLLPVWFGLQPAELLDALQDLEMITTATARPLEDALLAAGSGGPAGADRLWQALAALSDPAARVGPPLALPELVRSGVRAAAQALGVGERQYERRFRSAMGLTPRAWLRTRRFESALLALARENSGTAGLAQVAAGAGYADQAHLTRDVRASTGEPPAHLRRQLLANRPGYWAFCPARVGIVQDGNDTAG